MKAGSKSHPLLKHQSITKKSNYIDMTSMRKKHGHSLYSNYTSVQT